MNDEHLKTDTKDEFELSPLEQIRHMEAEVTRRVASARQAAEKVVVQARTKAAQQRMEEREAGRREGQERYQASITSAEDESRQILSQAQEQVDALRKRGEARLYAVVNQAINIILGVEGGGTQNHEH